MGEGFKKFKRKALVKALIKCAVCGLSFGLFAACGVLLLCKLLSVDLSYQLNRMIGIKLDFWIYVFIGVAVALVCGGIFFLIFMPRDKKLAVELDKKFNLNEKVQTALAFASENGDMYELQREDADATLVAIPRMSLTPKNIWQAFTQNISRIWQFFVIVLLAAAIAVAGIAMPSTVVEGTWSDDEPDDFPFMLRDEQIVAMQDLVSEVQASELGDDLKDTTVKHINRLLGNLILAEWESEKLALVNSTMRKIDTALSGATVYKQFADALARYERQDFAEMVATGAQAYRDGRLVEYSEVEAFWEERIEKVEERLPYEQITEIFDALQEDRAMAPAQIYIAAIVSRISEEESLYEIFMDLVADLTEWEGGGFPNQLQFYSDLCEALAAQAYIKAVDRYVCITISDVFGVEPLNDPLYEPGKAASEDEEDEEKKGTEGGYGPGTLQGGADDLIYNPFTGEYEKYMDILNEYYAIVDSMLRGSTLSEEQKEMIWTYFEILYGK